MDNHEQGYLTKESLLLTFQRNARDIEMEQVGEMMQELEINADTKIEYEQFRSLIDPNYDIWHNYQIQQTVLFQYHYW